MNRCILSAAAAISAIAAFAANERLLPLKNGAFDPEGGAWGMQPGASYATTSERNREHVLRLATDRPDGSTKAVQEIACEPQWSIMRVTYFLSVPEMKPGPKSWNCFKMAVNVRDASGKMWYLGAGEARQAFKGWRRMQFNVPIPAGAKTFKFYFENPYGVWSHSIIPLEK